MIECLIKENGECNEVITDILKILISEEIYQDALNNNKSSIEKAKEIDKSLKYILMRTKLFDNMPDFSDNELNNLDIDKVIEEYSKELKNEMEELFESKEISEKKYFLKINFPKTESMNYMKNFIF